MAKKKLTKTQQLALDTFMGQVNARLNGDDGPIEIPMDPNMSRSAEVVAAKRIRGRGLTTFIRYVEGKALMTIGS